MPRSSLLLSIVPLLLMACAPMVELEEESAAVQARLDSLEMHHADCRAENTLLRDRLDAIERENVQLDDKNRRLTARLAELQQEDPLITGAQPPRESADAGDAPPSALPSPDAAAYPPPASADAVQREEAVAAPSAILPADVRAVYDASTPADLSYLRAYQTALHAFNAERHGEALQQFEHLLQQSTPNDMGDNCLYWMGEAAMRLGRHAAAFKRFSAVLECAGSDKAAVALLGRANAAIALAQTAEARADLERVQREHPNTREAAEAARVMRTIR